MLVTECIVKFGKMHLQVSYNAFLMAVAPDFVSNKCPVCSTIHVQVESYGLPYPGIDGSG